MKVTSHTIPTPCRSATIAFLVLLLSSCGDTANNSIDDRTVWQIVSPCPFPAAAHLPGDRVTCGYMNVPESRSRLDSARIRFPVAVIHARQENRKRDPIVFVAGGPGAAPIESKSTFDLFSTHLFGDDRDVIIYTQRGGFGTEPELRCGDLDTARTEIYSKDQTLSERDKEIADLAIGCLRDLSDRGHDLNAYSAIENAADLVAIRKRLGISQWNLLAVSYGTLIALRAAKLDPDGTRALLLDSVVSPESDLFMSEAARNFAHGLETVLQACASDTDCNTAFPHLRASLARVIDRTREMPLSVPLNSHSDSSTRMTVNWHDVLGLIHWMLYNETTLAWVPALIDDVAAGNDATLAILLDRVFPAPSRPPGSSSGTFFAVVCRDQFGTREVSTTVDERYRGFAVTSFMADVCSDEHIAYPAEASRETPRLSVPSLLLSGAFDPMTPGIYAEHLLGALTNARLIRVPGFGHSTLSGYTACQTLVAADFLNNPGGEIDNECIGTLEPPEFETSAESIRRLLLQSANKERAN